VAVERRTSGIVTPEAVLLEFETAGVASRAIARIIDLVVQIFLLFAIVSAVSGIIGVATGNPEAIGIALIIISFLVIFGYPIGLEARWSGRTPGKALVGLRVVTREGAPGRFRHAAIRGIVGFVEVFGLPFISIFTTALSPANQRVGDLMAGTIVIRQRSAARMPIALAFPPPPGWEHYARTLDVSAMSVGQYRLIRSFLMRVLLLTPAARSRVALRLANPLARSMHHRPPPHLGPELFLVCAASAYQTRHGGPIPMPFGAGALPLPPGPAGPPGMWTGGPPAPAQ
jgi:uncharacterized RDD family membrane protein YckC